MVEAAGQNACGIADFAHRCRAEAALCEQLGGDLNQRSAPFGAWAFFRSIEPEAISMKKP
ncbi:hypothetical protein BJF84_07720 [Rhodococcus sp. CUA-806]|nr:hypothetical protein BJF84_07720 [Rhodococcus sp. CUA-806]